MQSPAAVYLQELRIAIREQLKSPTHLFPIVPPRFASAIELVLEAAGKCFLDFRVIQAVYHKRHYYTCSRRDPIHYNEHISTISRLFQWKAQYPGPNNPNLLPTAKLPCHAVQLHPDKREYEVLITRVGEMKHLFVTVTYLAWCNAKRNLDHLIASAFVWLPQSEELMIRSWWEGFLRQIPPWEDMLESIQLPEWEVVIGDLESKITEVVDLEGEWERLC
ncbi:hypothetical protein RJZ56_003793 [Blastomyces dermatitidis]|uniref:Uncharacterized protein n=2 Tax=Ajellomyces dermatitidis TaxID=5039 RepID=F2TFB0_AJEDA|nr:uncharacterized protein BDCG_00150 [Blastomyces dermatitidis ER-3]EEQ83345.1 hypothetical protein BDCG_00150 [Blastomyces dermatitidis ER-3]EGE81923.1 hypothetical protein BDDG_04866 [Blastomyces dermatitidis ATCC 18188]EQL35873.1 hypothetical protein BDFG_02481 [Blastomyces dermatitidis ATCC 26199]